MPQLFYKTTEIKNKNTVFKAWRHIPESMVSTTRIKHKLSFVKIRSQHHGFSGHHISTRVSMLFKSDPSRKLSSAYNKFRGRAKNGTVSVYSKGSTRKSRSIRYSTNLGSMKFFVIAGIPVRDPQSHKIAILYSSAAGYKMYLPMTNRTNLLRVMFGAEILFKTTVLGSMMKLGSYRHCEYASLVKFYSRICFIAVKHSSRVSIARASGSSATTMVKRVKSSSGQIPIKLPSGDVKLIASDVIVLLGYILPKKKKLFKNTRAGYWRNIGVKPTVRGVVKNPVDHPHGGRAKTVLWQRTPWGKSTK